MSVGGANLEVEREIGIPPLIASLRPSTAIIIVSSFWRKARRIGVAFDSRHSKGARAAGSLLFLYGCLINFRTRLIEHYYTACCPQFHIGSDLPRNHIGLCNARPGNVACRGASRLLPPGHFALVAFEHPFRQAKTDPDGNYPDGT